MDPSGRLSLENEFHFNNPSLKESLQILIDSNQICAKLKNLYREDSTSLQNKCQNEIVGKRSFLDLRKQEQFDVENLLFLLQQKLDLLLLHMKNADDYDQNKEKFKRNLIHTIDGYKKLLSNIKNVLREDSINTGVDYFRSYGSLYSLNDKKSENTENPNDDKDKIYKILEFSKVDENLYKVVDECLNHYKNLDQKYRESLATVLQDKVDNNVVQRMEREFSDLNHSYHELQQKFEEKNKALEQMQALHEDNIKELNQKLNSINREKERQKVEIIEMSAQIDDLVANNQSPLNMEPRTIPDFMKQSLPTKFNFLIEKFKTLLLSNHELKSSKQGAVQTVNRASQMLEGVLIDHYSAKSSKKSHKSTSTEDLPGIKAKKILNKHMKYKGENQNFQAEKTKSTMATNETTLSLSGTLFQPSLNGEGGTLTEKCSLSSVKSEECPSQDDLGKNQELELFIRLVRETSLIDKVIALVRILDYLITDLKNTKKRAKQKILRAQIEAKRANTSTCQEYKMLQRRYELLKRYVYDQQITIRNLLRAKGEMDRRVSLWIDALKQENMPKEIKSILQIQSELSTSTTDISQDQPSLSHIGSHLKQNTNVNDFNIIEKNLKNDENAEQKYREFVESIKKNSVTKQTLKADHLNEKDIKNFSGTDQFYRNVSDSRLLNIAQDSNLSKSQSLDLSSANRSNKTNLPSIISPASTNFSALLADDANKKHSANIIGLSKQFSNPPPITPSKTVLQATSKLFKGPVRDEDKASKLESTSKVSFVDSHPFVSNQWTSRGSSRHFDPTRISTPTKYIPPEFLGLDMTGSAFSNTQDSSLYVSPLQASSHLRKSQKSSDYYSLSQSQNTTESLLSDKYIDRQRKPSNRKKSSITISNRKLQRKASGASSIKSNKKHSQSQEDDPSTYYSFLKQPLLDQSLDLATTTTYGTPGQGTHSFRDYIPVPFSSPAKNNRLATKKASSSYLYDLVLELSPSLSIIPADASTPLIASDQLSPIKLTMAKETLECVNSDNPSLKIMNQLQNKKSPNQKTLIDLHNQPAAHQNLNKGLHDIHSENQCHCCLEYPEIRKVLNLTLFPAYDDMAEELDNRDDGENMADKENKILPPSNARKINKEDIENYKEIVESILAKHIENRHLINPKENK